jgi:two-component system LytT family response regulator
MSALRALRVLIADDELPAREHIRSLLAKDPAFEVIATAESGKAAVAVLMKHDIDLVFLDVQMPGMNGFQVISEIGAQFMPSTIFVTAFDQYAVKAFDLAAVDYLLKPFDDERFELALKRVKRLDDLRHSGELGERLRKALNLVGLEDTATDATVPAREWLDRIAVESRGQVRMILVKDIDYIGASGVYAELHVGNRTHVLRERMQSLEARLNPRQFFRVHRSVIVQLDRIDALLRQGGGDYSLRLTTGAQVSVSRSRVEQLERWMGLTGSGRAEP